MHRTLGEGKSAFEYIGSYENNLRHGEGTERLLDTELTYSGRWSNDLFHGFGRFFVGNNKIKYEVALCFGLPTVPEIAVNK